MPPKKGSNNKAASQKTQNAQSSEGDYIVFGDDKKKTKTKRNQKDASEAEASSPAKPSARQVIGGASWTGKLPVNLLSEHCQKQKWNKPEYSMRQMPGKSEDIKTYRSAVTLSKTDPKTKEVTTLPAFRLPDTHAHLADEPSALEARHFAATYALYRISSMKQIHMMLPPKYRDLWKTDFQQLKVEDEKEGRGWKYDADPFAAEEKRQEIHAAMETRRKEKEKQQAAATNGPSLVLPIRKKGKGWDDAPKIEMGQKIRSEIETLVRQNACWNPNDLKLDDQQKKAILKDLNGLGFRKSHVEEAISYCKDKEEVIEWLLVHVPEDDLPPFALPAGYTAGVSLASGDGVKEAILRRLSAAGYPLDLCNKALKASFGHEQLASRWLQNTLMPNFSGRPTSRPLDASTWQDEMVALEAIMVDRFSSSLKNECTIDIETADGQTLSLRFICPPSGYPEVIPTILMISDKLPAYIRLSATKRVLKYAEENLLGEAMVFNICEWLSMNLPDIVDNPVRLKDLRLEDDRERGVVTTVNSFESQNRAIHRSRRLKVDRRSNEEILDLWKVRQQSTQQQQMTTVRKRLPAWSKQQEIIQAISSKQVTIISGETGSGKSTQAVQFVLDDAIQNLAGSTTNIVCTQPRRVAALSLADRVSSERCNVVGEEVGYVIRGESKTSDLSKITFMTTGVLLRRLQTSSSLEEALKGLSHVFLDEVHERSLDTDFLLSLLRDFLKTKPSMKVVLMSATLDAEIFCNYFGGLKNVAQVEIEGRTYPVTDCYLDEVLQLTKSRLRNDEVDIDADMGKTIQSLGSGINYDLIRNTVQYIDQELGSHPGAILIFLPGTLEIDRCLKSISTLSNVSALPLHASLLPSEQRRVFPPPASGQRKVIAATNVAETSITIEDIVAVIDTGRVKETNFDVQNNVVRLQEVWASRAACKQRRGRAGRVRAGHCYKLFTKQAETKMHAKPLPEIQRVPLEQLCLSVKATGQDRDVIQFLSQTLSPPNTGAITNAINTLHEMGALEDGQLTALGTYLSMIPADLRCAKLLIFGALFDCLESCLTVASILTVRSPFVSPKDKRDEAKAARKTFSTSGGDVLLDLAAYDEYREISQSVRYKDQQIWCNERFLSLQTLRDITSTRSQLLDSLKDANLIPVTYRSPPNPMQHSQLLLRALIAAALQPQIAAISFPDKKFMQSHTGAKELDPEARTIKYFIPAPNSPSTDDRSNRERIFVHPSSVLFDAQSFTGSAAYLSYFTKMATGANPKTYIRELTPLNAYALLLFGGKIEVDTSGAGITVGKSFNMQGWARIGVLVSRLRALLDDELRQALDQPSVDFVKSRVVKVVKKLVELNGQDQ